MSLESHLESGTTTICYCWVIRRRDGVVIGLTDHDGEVTAGGVVCNATTGITTTKFEQSLGMLDDTLEISGVLDDDRITEADIRAGIYDEAEVDLYMVNWVNNAEFEHISNGRFGSLMDIEGGGFVTEFRSMTHRLGQQEGKTFQRNCQTELGSPECGIDLTSPTYRGDFNVTSFDDQTIILDDIGSFDDGWFDLGKILIGDAEFWIQTQVGTTLKLWQRPQIDIQPGQTVTVIAGCKRDLETCRSKFDNIEQFRGFPYIPGNDRVTSYPIRGEDDYDGGSLFR